MIQPFLSTPGRRPQQIARVALLAAVGATSLLAAAATAAPLPYPQAVANSDAAARAVLARAGRETCLRGKLTRALLGLSDSCAASGMTNPLCSLADKAVVVTPMSLSFMDETSQQLLDLIHPDKAAAQASARPAASEPAASEP